jgi:tetratricopeptide (TPR) repeat protein
MNSEARDSNSEGPRQPGSPSDFDLRPSFGFRISDFEFLIPLLLALITLLIYLPVRHFSFLRFDDADYVTDNGMVQSGLTWAGVKWAFTTFHASNWHPLTWLSHMLDVTLFGTGPAGPHLVNVALHTANTVLLFLVLLKFTARQARALWRSALVAALFALHPLHVESVAWVAERKDVLSTFFFLLTLLAYERYVSGVRGRVPGIEGTSNIEGGGKENVQHSTFNIQHSRDGSPDHRSQVTDHRSPYYALCLFLFALGLMSKPMLVTAPFVLLLLDFWPLARVSGPGCQVSGADSSLTQHATRNTQYAIRNTLLPLLLEKIPFFLLAALSCVLTFAAQKHGGAVRSLTSFPIGERLGNALVSYAQYLGKTFWPFDLAIFYPHPGQWPAAQIVLAGVVIAAVCVAVVWLGRRIPFAAMGWFWFLGTLVPTIGLVQVSNQSMADRYTYLPSIGLFIMIAWGLGEAVSRRRGHKAAIGIAMGLVLIACAVRTGDQLRYWRDGESLFRHALAVTDRNFVAHNNLGNVLMDKGEVDEAMTHYQTALEIQPRYADALNNLGSAQLEKDRVDEAIASYEKALALQPDFALAHNNLGNALLRKGHVDEAIAQYRKTLAFRPDYANAWNNLGTAFRQKGQLDEAIASYRKALSIHPNHARAHNNLGDVLLQQGHLDEAVAEFQRVVQIQPDFADAHHNLGVIMLQRGRADEAAVHFLKAVELRPDDAEAHNNLGFCLMQSGQVDESIGHFQRAQEIRPGFAEAHNNLGFVLLQKGRVPEALTHLETAAKLQPDNALTLSGLAWVLATCPDAAVRNGARAVELAEQANQQTGGQDPMILRALAAAYAETGRFSDAQAAARRALQLAEAGSNAMLSDMLRLEMKSYQAGSPFRDAGQ